MGNCTYKFPFEKNRVLIPVVDLSTEGYGHPTTWRFRVEGPKAEK